MSPLHVSAMRFRPGLLLGKGAHRHRACGAAGRLPIWSMLLLTKAHDLKRGCAERPLSVCFMDGFCARIAADWTMRMKAREETGRHQVTCQPEQPNKGHEAKPPAPTFNIWAPLRIPVQQPGHVDSADSASALSPLAPGTPPCSGLSININCINFVLTIDLFLFAWIGLCRRFFFFVLSSAGTLSMSCSSRRRVEALDSGKPETDPDTPHKR